MLTSSSTTIMSAYTQTAPIAEYVMHPGGSMITTTSFTIQPIHQRTRSLPLTEETAIQVTSFHSNVSPSPPLPYICKCITKCHNNNNNNNDTNISCQLHQQQQSLNKSCSLLLSSNNNTNKNHLLYHQHHSLNHPTTMTTISHFYNRHNSNSLDLINDRAGKNITGTEQIVPQPTNSMESIVENQTLQMADYLQMDEVPKLTATVQQQWNHNNNNINNNSNNNNNNYSSNCNNKQTTAFCIGGNVVHSPYFLGGSPLSMRRGGRGNTVGSSRSMYFCCNTYNHIFFLSFSILLS